MMLDYFYGQSGELFSYFRIPKALFQDCRFRQLSTDARTLYGILLDRMSLSVKNGWLDEQGRVYIIEILERRIQEEDSAEVNEMVRTAKVTPEQLAALLRQSATATPNPAALSAVGATFEKEVDADED